MTIQHAAIVAGYEQSLVSLEGSEPVRAFLHTGRRQCGTGPCRPLLAQDDLLALVGQFDGLGVQLHRSHASVRSDDGTFEFQAPVIFAAGIGLKCFDLRGSGWDFLEEHASAPHAPAAA